jgi:hypothetical protein
MTDRGGDSDVGPDDVLLPDEQAIAADLRAVFVHDADPELTQRFVDAMASAAGGAVLPRRSLRRRRAAMAGAVVVAGLFTTVGLAAADVLPTPIQDGVARLVRPLGIDLPDSGDDDGSRGAIEHDPATTFDRERPGATTDSPGPGSDNPGSAGAAPGQTAAGGNNQPVVPPGQVDNPGNRNGNGPPASVPGNGNGNGNGNGPPASVPGNGNGNGPPASVPGNGPPASVPGNGTPGSPPASTPGKGSG